MTDRAEEVARLRAITEQLHSPCVHGDNPCDECLVIPLRAYAEEARQQEREAWIAALCPSCNRGHVLGNSRVWAFCGSRKAIPGVSEEVVAATIRARGEKG